MNAGVFTYLRMNGPRRDPRTMTKETWVRVSCDECKKARSIRRATIERNGNPGECCGQVLTIEDA